MPFFSRISRTRKEQGTFGVQLVMDTAIQYWDFSVICVHRGKDEQDEAFSGGVSTKEWPNSRHNKIPSSAMDLAPYYPEVPKGGIDWRTDAALMVAIKRGDMREIKSILENIKRWMAFSGFIRGVGVGKGVILRSGSDWDSDQRFNDHKLIDLPHFEEVIK